MIAHEKLFRDKISVRTVLGPTLKRKKQRDGTVVTVVVCPTFIPLRNASVFLGSTAFAKRSRRQWPKGWRDGLRRVCQKEVAIQPEILPRLNATIVPAECFAEK